jgi:hypothetical protein
VSLLRQQPLSDLQNRQGVVDYQDAQGLV